MKLKQLLHDERGQTLVITAVCLTSLLGMAGLSVDAGLMFRAKRVLQTAADAGAIAGSAEVNYGDWNAAALAATAQNGVTNGVNGTVVTPNNPPTSGTKVGNSKYVEVLISQSEPTFFMKVFGLGSMTVTARAVAGLGAGSGCIFTLDTSGTDVGLSGSGALSMPDCGIVVNSTSSNAVNLTGSSSLSASSIGVVGGYNDSSSGGINPTPVTGIAPVADPLSFESAPTFSVASCLPSTTINHDATIGPTAADGTGVVCYNGLSISGNANVTLRPGVYIINGNFSNSGGSVVSGTGVTFYLPSPSGQVSLTGGGALNVSAPLSGTYNGILFYEDPTNTNTMKVAGGGSSDIEGIFYAPAATLTFSGNAGSVIYADMVVSALSLTGTSNLNNYSTKNINEPITSARLVE